ncbi:type 1 glutamine amidotransferase [Bacillus toyonensis]|uniref:type 1 glutamine amidotransferase n=1 Tax=Bacillus toyonensis TaxID=155322 RepID=UPI0018D0DD37|nr:type 1 glutamine amidotransferase [Bacillus toyonensis]MBH0357100.1 amidotransferase [Bacillus toyonensis biovar Thuringiensis]
MKIHYLQHVPFELPEHISVWAKEKGHEITGTLLYENYYLPELSEFDLLVILGGPMGVDDEDKHPWLVLEKHFIKEAIQHRKLVIGICLGAQLIAEILGGKVYKNHYKEIGWFPVKLVEAAKESAFFKEFPGVFIPFHWHGDTFELPPQAKRIAYSEGCMNQAYVYEDHVIGLQFHLESSADSIKELIRHCADDIEQGMYVQRPHEMLNEIGSLALSKANLFALLDAMEMWYRSRGEKC